MAPHGDGSASGASPNLVVSFGEMLIDFVPDVAGLSLAESGGFVKAPGGAPANVACAISKLGGSSAFLGKFGDDEFGHMLVNILKQNGVNAEGCLFDQHARTALAFVTLKKNGEREFMFYRNPSADMLLTEAELNLDLIRRAKIFHYGSISLISEPCRGAHLAAMRAAKAAGILCSYDPNVRLPLWPSEEAARAGILSIWKEADFIKVSDDEVAFLTQGDATDEKNVLSLWFDGLKLLIVTDGDKGCRYFTKAITLCPNVAVYWTNRALCYKKRSEWAKVEEDCRRAIQLDSQSVKGHYMLGLALVNSQRLSEGIKALEKSLELGRGAHPASYMVEEIWQELSKAKYIEWEGLSRERTSQLQKLKVVCKEALRNYNSLSNPAADAPEEQLNELEEVFKKAAKTDTPAEVPDHLCCKITLDIFRDPVITPSGVTYERAVLLDHLQTVGKFDPLTREALEPHQLVPNLAIKEAVHAFLSEHGWAYKIR